MGVDIFVFATPACMTANSVIGLWPEICVMCDVLACLMCLDVPPTPPPFQPSLGCTRVPIECFNDQDLQIA